MEWSWRSGSWRSGLICPSFICRHMSAHPAEVLVRHGLASLDVPFLAKPYTRDEALAKVRLALERQHGSRTETRRR